MQKRFLKYNFLLFVAAIGLINCGSPKRAAVFSPSSHELNIEWNQTTLKQLAKPVVISEHEYFSYPRMIETSQGKLYSVFQHNGDIEMIVSADGGSNWSQPCTITSARNNINVANPEMIELNNGSLILAYNLRPRPNADGSYDPAKKFSICVKRSLDGGVSWSDEQLLYEAGSEFKKGCWEPSMLQLPSGEVRLFFANEGPYTLTEEQNISMLTSPDNGLSWTKTPQIVSFAKNFRDGMPVPILDRATGQIWFAIEDNSEGGEFNPSVIKLTRNNSTFVDAESPDRLHLLNTEISKQVYAGAPYIKKFKNGAFALSFQSTLNRNKDWRLSTMEVAVGKDLNRLHLATRPFNVPIDKSALWNALCITHDDSIIAVSSTNAFTGYTSIWMIKGKIK